MSRVITGIDPDTKATGLATIWVDDRDQIQKFDFKSADIGSRLRSPVEARADMARAIANALYRDSTANATEVAIEFQHIRPREVNPNSIMAIQAVAGMALAAAADWEWSTIHIPIPSEWKGTVPKEIHQKRILAEAGLTIDSPEFAHIPRSKRTHCIDALGLCLWVRRGCKIR